MSFKFLLQWIIIEFGKIDLINPIQKKFKGALSVIIFSWILYLSKKWKYSFWIFLNLSESIKVESNSPSLKKYLLIKDLKYGNSPDP